MKGLEIYQDIGDEQETKTENKDIINDGRQGKKSKNKKRIRKNKNKEFETKEGGQYSDTVGNKTRTRDQDTRQ